MGTTLRLRNDGSGEPDELRHVQVQQNAYGRFRRTGRFPDGAAFLVTFHGLKADAAHGPGDPPLLAQDAERFVGVEILDRQHPDGRRFYSFPARATQALALPAGNACAACHRARGDSQGLFTAHYPATRAAARDVR